jgi:hypothetical protein
MLMDDWVAIIWNSIIQEMKLQALVLKKNKVTKSSDIKKCSW